VHQILPEFGQWEAQKSKLICTHFQGKHSDTLQDEGSLQPLPTAMGTSDQIKTERCDSVKCIT
jgi:hypothetical protein